MSIFSGKFYFTLQAQVERVVPWRAVVMRRRLNALTNGIAALPPDMYCAFGGPSAIAFGEIDPPKSKELASCLASS